MTIARTRHPAPANIPVLTTTADSRLSGETVFNSIIFWPTGGDDGAALTAMIAAEEMAYLAGGAMRTIDLVGGLTYYLDSPVTLRSHLRWNWNGARIVSTQAASGGQNASMFSSIAANAWESVGAMKTATVLTTAAAIGDTSVKVNSVTTPNIDDGDEIEIVETTQLQMGHVFKVISRTAATVTGTVDLTGLAYPGDFGVKNITMTVGGVAQLLTFASPANAGEVVTQLNAAILAAFGSQVVTADLVTAKYLRLTAATPETGSIALTNGTLAAATIGFASAALAGVTLTLDPNKPLIFPWPVANTAVWKVTYRPHDIHIDGGGGTFSGTGDRGFHIIAGRNCSIKNITYDVADGALSDVVASFDVGGYRCHFENFNVEGDRAHPSAVGLFIESGEDCTAERCNIAGTTVGVELIDSIHCRAKGIHASYCYHGVNVSNYSPSSGYDNLVEDVHGLNCGGAAGNNLGSVVWVNAPRTTVRDITSKYATHCGVLVSTAGTGSRIYNYQGLYNSTDIVSYVGVAVDGLRTTVSATGIAWNSYQETITGNVTALAGNGENMTISNVEVYGPAGASSKLLMRFGGGNGTTHRLRNVNIKLLGYTNGYGIYAYVAGTTLSLYNVYGSTDGAGMVGVDGPATVVIYADQASPFLSYAVQYGANPTKHLITWT